jgi:hypothetical protein
MDSSRVRSRCSYKIVFQHARNALYCRPPWSGPLADSPITAQSFYGYLSRSGRRALSSEVSDLVPALPCAKLTHCGDSPVDSLMDCTVEDRTDSCRIAHAATVTRSHAGPASCKCLLITLRRAFARSAFIGISPSNNLSRMLSMGTVGHVFNKGGSLPRATASTIAMLILIHSARSTPRR